MTDPHPDGDLLLTLVLDDAEDTERDATLRHLAACRRCRNEYDALSATVEQTLAAAPNVEPAPGFETSVLAAMGFERTPHSSAPTPHAHQRPRPRRTWQLVAASVVLGLGVGLGVGAGGALTLTRPDDAPAPRQLAAGSAFLDTRDGEHVGTVTHSFVDGEPVLVMHVTSGRAGMKYLCLLRLRNGKQMKSADWVLRSDRGATWIVKEPGTPVTELVLVANGGAGPVWSTARL